MKAKKKKRTGQIRLNNLLDTVEEELGKFTMLKSSCLAHALEDQVSVNIKHTNTRVNVELFGVGVILWNTISLSNLFSFCSVCQNQENMLSVQQMPRAVFDVWKVLIVFALCCDGELIREWRSVTVKWADRIDLPIKKCSPRL